MVLDSPPHRCLVPFIDALKIQGRLRVWSIVVSILGDIVHPSDRPISLQGLGALTRPMGVTPNALRTALSRLAKEDWVIRYKDGRNSYYRLGKTGQAEVEAASRRIYCRSLSSGDETWSVSIYPTADLGAGLTLNRFTQINAAPLPSDAPDEKGVSALRINGQPDQIPTWVVDTLVPLDLRQAYGDLATMIEVAAGQAHDVDADTALILRYVIIHFWRRLVLRHPVLPKNLLPDDWQGAACLAQIRNLYPRLVGLSETREPGSNQAELRNRF